MQDYWNLKVWQQSHQMVLAVYKATMTFPADAELDYHLLLAFDLKMLEETTYREILPLLTDVRRMLNGFIQKLRANG